MRDMAFVIPSRVDMECCLREGLSPAGEDDVLCERFLCRRTGRSIS